jgi:hypothetical protein
MPSVVMLSLIMLSVVMLSLIMLNVVMLSVVALLKFVKFFLRLFRSFVFFDQFCEISFTIEIAK